MKPEQEHSNKPTAPAPVAAANTTWPTVAQLTSIAATLAIRRDGPNDAGKIAYDAFDLWAACGREIKERWEMRTQAPVPCEPPLPEPKSYPLSLDDFLRLVLRDKRTEDRMKIYREHLRASVPFSRWQRARCPGSGGSVLEVQREEFLPLTDKQVAAVIQEKRIRQFDKSQFENAAAQLIKWLPEYEAMNRTGKAAKAASTRWKKNSRKRR